MNKSKKFRDENLHQGKWIESDEEFKRFLDEMNHKTLDDVKESDIFYNVAVDFFHWWWNETGTNTGKAFSKWWEENKSKHLAELEKIKL